MRKNRSKNEMVDSTKSGKKIEQSRVPLQATRDFKEAIVLRPALLILRNEEREEEKKSLAVHVTVNFYQTTD